MRKSDGQKVIADVLLSEISKQVMEWREGEFHAFEDEITSERNTVA